MVLINAKYNETILQQYLQINNAYKNKCRFILETNRKI